MATFNTGLWVPNAGTDTSRGGGCATIIIETLTDYSAVQVGATWDVLSLFSEKDYDFGSQGGGQKPLDLQFVDGEQVTLADSSTVNSQITKALKFTTHRESAVLMEWLDTVKGKKYFIVDLVNVIGTTKLVLFSFGYWDMKMSRKSTFGSAVAYDLNFVCQAHGLATTPTFPALPVNSDTKFGTDAASKKYLGWLLATADATKGGYGNAVALPTTGELNSTKCGITKAI